MKLPPDIRLRHATDIDMLACRTMLPLAFTTSSAPAAIVAVQDGVTQGIAGCCAIAWANAPKPEAEPSGFPMQVYVVPTLRRRGIGQAMLHAAAEWCRTETTGLRTWLPVADGSAEASFLTNSGFVLHHRTLHFETGLAQFHTIVDGLRQRLARSGRLPAGARIVPLGTIPAWDVAVLVAPEFAAPHAEIIRRLSPAAPDGFDLLRSVGLMDGPTLAGALIFTWNGGAVAIEVIVVAAPYRGGAANVLLLEAATRSALDGGASHFRFFCDERVKDTIGLARRAGALPIRIEGEYRRAFA